MRTLVELYDNCQIKNVIAGLSFNPKKIIFVGFAKTMENSHRKALEKFFRMKNINATIEYECVDRYDYSSIVSKLTTIVDENPGCCFDLTGGKELVLVAMGAISTKYKIPMIQFDVETGKLIRVDNCGILLNPKKKSISIEECVALNGGGVVKETGDCPQWEMTKEFCRDIELIWEICRIDSAAWNSNAVALGTLEKNGTVSSDLCVKGNSGGSGKNKISDFIMKSLERAKIISAFKNQKGLITFKYKNNQVRHAIIKSGNSLELLTYMLSQEVSKEHSGCFTDADVSVMIDWDGIIHDDFIAGRDTRNEIDVVLMKNHIPVFISCKNGAVQKEALYELQAVADKFGGEYVKKILITTYINKNINSRNFILQRAKDMGIKIIDGVEKMSKEKIKEALYNSTR